MNVEDIMTTDVVTVSVDATFRQVAEAMLDAGVSGLPVLDGDGAVVGVVTEADLVAREAHPGGNRLLGALMSVLAGTDENWWRKAEGLNAGQLMSRPPVTARPGEGIQAVARRMLSHRVKRLPVVEPGGRLVGIVARADLIAVYERTDEQLGSDVYELVHDPSRHEAGDEVGFDVREATVTLTGTASSPSHRRALVAAVRAVPGVIDVVDRLEERHAAGGDGSPLERVRHTGVGVEDPNIWPPPEEPPAPVEQAGRANAPIAPPPPERYRPDGAERTHLPPHPRR